MWRFVRSAVMWLVAVALPLQGLAAATMLSCGPGHGRLAAAQAAAPATHEQAAHDHAAHHHGAAAQHAASADAADGEPAVGQLHDIAKFKCSACAACCSATALPASAIVFEPPRLQAAFDALPLTPSVHFQTSGPERPPRHHFA